MIELAKAAFFFDYTKVPVALGADEVVGGDRVPMNFATWPSNRVISPATAF